eukprot:15479881-Alexandrium_andersonii.AAC.1
MRPPCGHHAATMRPPCSHHAATMEAAEKLPESRQEAAKRSQAPPESHQFVAGKPLRKRPLGEQPCAAREDVGKPTG